MTDPHDMVGIGYPGTAVPNYTPHTPRAMTVRSMDVSARMDAPTGPDPDRKWFVLWLVGGAILWFSPDPDPGPEMRSTR